MKSLKQKMNETFKENNESKKSMEVYVRYMDSKNHYKESTKDFETYAKAWKWVQDTFDTPSTDFIYYY